MHSSTPTAMMSKLLGTHSSRLKGGSHSPMFHVPVQMERDYLRGDQEKYQRLVVVALHVLEKRGTQLLPQLLDRHLMVFLQFGRLGMTVIAGTNSLQIWSDGSARCDVIVLVDALELLSIRQTLRDQKSDKR